MIRILIAAVLVVVAFLAAMVVPMALTGTLNADSLLRLLGLSAAAPATAPAAPTKISPLSQMLKSELESVRLKAAQLDERSTQLDLRQTELEAMLREIEVQEDLLKSYMDDLDADQDEGLTAKAKMMGVMDPEVAATSIEAMDPQDAAAILRLLKDKQSAAILDAILDVADRNLILEYIGEPKY
jgi:flagellar motility protein MotE (MotC chaperone)